jgi:RimJ/RimL family protein N-acetyltransferase
MRKLLLRAVDVDSTADLAYLYGVLSRRLDEPGTNLSHKELPGYDQHCAFVQTRPYLAHYLIQDRRTLVGVVYLTPLHEIGIWVAPDHRREGIGDWALLTLMRLHRGKVREWLANVNRENKASQKFFVRHGFRLSIASPEALTYARAGEESGE